jgi:methionine-rich copper-binding protein CopC
VRRRIVVAATISVAAALGASGTAWAHAALEASAPRQGAVLKRPPARASLTFSEPVGRIVSVRVTRNGRGNLARAARIAPRDAARVVVSLRRPGRRAWAGRYRIVWRVRSADGHVIRGVVGYRVRR